MHVDPAAAAKSLQSCPTLCDPIDGSPPGSPVPRILQARNWSGLPFPSLCCPMCLLLPSSDLQTSSSCPSNCNADWNWVCLLEDWTQIILRTLPKSILYCCLFLNQLTKLFCLCYLYYLFIQYLSHSLPTFWACKQQQQLESANT